MDPFEEFEFKPLTDGLGFHKKKASASSEASSQPEKTASSSALFKSQNLELIDEGSTDPLRPPLPRKKSASAIPAAPGGLTEVGGDGSTSSTAVDEILKTLQKNRRLDFENTKTKVTATPKADEYVPTRWSFSASILDGMLVLAGGLLCMIILLVITKVDLIGNLTNPDEAGMIYIATASLFAGVSFIYLVINRIFMGSTPGEWAFDQRIGRPEETNSAAYALKVVGRSALVIATGFILFPLLSLILNKDLAGAITGARLHKKV